MTLLDVRDLNVWFDLSGDREFHAVKDVGLSLEPGQRLGLVGESGSGKTTTALAVMGLLPSSASASGQVAIRGKDLMPGGEDGFRAHRWTDVAMVFQGAMNAFNPVRTVGWQIAEPMQAHGTASGAAARTRVGELLELVGIPAAAAGRYPHEFSGGMRQRAAIAMALACDPKILLADEPTTALDVMVQAQILELLTRLCSELDLALLLVTHDLAVVAQTCDEVAVMYGGEVVERGPIDQLFHSAAHPYTRALFAATPDLYGGPAGGSGASAEAADSSTLLAVQGLSTSYQSRHTLTDRIARRPRRDVQAIDGVSLSVAKGEMLAIVGESGCGKTTTAQSILGMVPTSGGSVLINGVDVTQLSARQMRPLRRHVQMIYQDPYESLDVRFKVRQTVEEPLLVHGIGATRAERAALVRTAMERAELTPPEAFLERYPHQLSGGQRQRVAIAASLVLEPELLLADEPVSMLDVSVRAGVLALLDRLRRGGTMGVVMITHDLSTAAHFADRIAVMYLGRIVEQGTAHDVIHRPQHPYTKALLSIVPRPDPRERSLGTILRGETPDPRNIPSGCRFHPRCPVAEDRCRTTDPVLAPPKHPEPGTVPAHVSACLLA